MTSLWLQMVPLDDIQLLYNFKVCAGLVTLLSVDLIINQSMSGIRHELTFVINVPA